MHLNNAPPPFLLPSPSKKPITHPPTHPPTNPILFPNTFNKHTHISTQETSNPPLFSPQTAMLGRSDGVLKPSGVRFGSAEIYNVLTRFFASTIADAVCVGRRRPDVDKDEAVLLFVVMRTPEDSPSSPPSTTTSSTASTTSASTNGTTTTTDEKAPRLFVKGVTDEQIKQVIRRELSPRHVPAVVAECGPEGVPRTGNGKKIEVAVKAIVSGLPVKTNASVANPGALEWFRGWAERN